MFRKPYYYTKTMKVPKSKTILISLLVLSAFIHLWNPVGFPEIFYDEGIYMHRAMNVVNGIGPQEGKFYDHPFFGQIFLGSILYGLGHPDSTSYDKDSTQNLYAAPRILMGLLAIFDTFLIYKIAQKRYNTKIALFATLLFAVMPITWITRRILLDSILLPFTLLSILFVLYSKDSTHKSWLVLFSGVFVGLAIFTKIPAFTILPVLTYLVYSTHKNKKLVVLLITPAVLLPMIWPAYAITHDQFEYWKKDVLWQAQRENTGIHNTALSFGAIDPVLFGLGIAGLIYSGIKKNWFLLIWTIPFTVFLSVIGYTQYFHWMILLPAFCIAASFMIADIGKTIRQRQIVPICVILLVASFGFASHIALLNLDVSKNQFEAMSFAFDLAQKKNTIVLAGPQLSWIYDDVIGSNTFQDYSRVLFKQAPDKFILVADPHFHLDLYRGQELSQIYNSTVTTAVFPNAKSNYDVYAYPYSSLGYNYDAGLIEVKITGNLSN